MVTQLAQTPPASDEPLEGLRRSAALLIALGPEASARVLAQLKDHEVERLTREIAGLNVVPSEVRNEVLEEAYRALVNREFAASGGIDFAQSMLLQAFGPERARELSERISESASPAPFAFARELDAGQLVSFLTGEHPQTVALVLAYADPMVAGPVLRLLAPTLQAEVSLRIARLERISPEIIREVEEIMASKLSRSFEPGINLLKTSGPAALVRLLKSVDRATERSVIEALDQLEPQLAEEVRKRMLMFDSILQLDDRSVQRVLREVEVRDLALALKGAGEDVRDKIFRNMSGRAASMLQDDLAALGAVRLRNVDAAQGNIVNIIRSLDEAEEIVISRRDDEVLN